MGQGLDIELVRAYYERISDNELIRIATSDARGLTPEANAVVTEEIKRRRLNKNILKGIDAQQRPYSKEEIEDFCEIVRNLSCPTCGTTSTKLNGTLTMEVESFVYASNTIKKLKVGCPDCLDKANNHALRRTVLFGWWKIPTGIIKTIAAIGHNTSCKSTTNHATTTNQYLRQFVSSNIGQLEAYKEDKKKLQEVIAYS